MKKQRRKPTIAELEAILDSPEAPEIKILPNGEIRAVRRKRPKILTAQQVLGGAY